MRRGGQGLKVVREGPTRGIQKRRDEGWPSLFAKQGTGVNVHRLIVIGDDRHTQGSQGIDDGTSSTPIGSSYNQNGKTTMMIVREKETIVLKVMRMSHQWWNRPTPQEHGKTHHMNQKIQH